jgi:hypothetical protein
VGRVVFAGGGLFHLSLIAAVSTGISALCHAAIRPDDGVQRLRHTGRPFPTP